MELERKQSESMDQTRDDFDVRVKDVLEEIADLIEKNETNEERVNKFKTDAERIIEEALRKN